MNVPDWLNSLSPQQSALWMFDDLQLNVFPLPYGYKFGTPWKQLQTTRLERNRPRDGLKALTERPCNLAVMTGRTSGNLFVLDYETLPGFFEAIRLCQQHHIPVWASLTTRGGHLWFRCADGVVKSVRSEQMEVRGSSGYVVAPPSFNAQSGITYRWMLCEGDTIPVVHTDDLSFLSLLLKTERTAHAPEMEGLCPHSTAGRRLNHSTQRYLEFGRSYPKGTRHIAYFNACCDYIEKGYNYGDIQRDLMPIARASGLPDDGDSTVLTRVALWASEHVHPRNPNTAHPHAFAWQKALNFLMQHTREDFSNNTDRAVALALIWRARQFCNKNGTFRASYREIRLLAHIGNNQTVKRSLARLKAIPFICYAGSDGTTGATLWRFSDTVLKTNCAETEPLSLNTRETPLVPPPCNISNGSLSTLLNMLDSDVLERGALGVGGLCVYIALLSFPGAVAFGEVVEAAGLSPGQVRYALRKDGWLRKAGLVQRVKGGWGAQAVTRQQLIERVARPAGRFGKTARRAKTFARERAILAGREIAQAQYERRMASPAPLRQAVPSFVGRPAVSDFVPYRG